MTTQVLVDFNQNFYIFRGTILVLMKYYLCLVFSIVATFGIAQSNTEIFLYDVNSNNSSITLSNGKNISNNEGYDNQPSFLNDERILFSSSRNGQTDIAQYFGNYGSKVWVNFTEGGEYSPIKIPNKNAVSAVRLDKDGKQRLYSYNLSNGESTELIPNLVVAYYTWFDEHTIVSAAIEDKLLNLYVTNLQNGTNQKLASNVGRSFHKIPNSNLVSFISKENANQWQIKSLNPKTGAIKLVANTMQNVEDICWLDANTLLSGKDNTLYKLRLRRDNDWKTVADLSADGIIKITRLATNPSATQLAIAADINATTNNTNDDSTTEPVDDNTNTTETPNPVNEEQAAVIVQRHIKPFNDRNLEAFANAFHTNVVVNRFPNDKMYSGRNTLKEGYRKYFNDIKKSNVKVINRMTLKNLVIDEELVTVNNKTIRQATIYTTADNSIASMTFIRNNNTSSNPEAIVNQQLEAYNNRNIDAFAKTYSNTIKLYTFPDKLTSEGQQALRKGYAEFFKRVPDLNAEIVNRIVLGNKVIDKEKVTINGEFFYAIAIYEVKNGLISKVTFIQ